MKAVVWTRYGPPEAHRYVKHGYKVGNVVVTVAHKGEGMGAAGH